MGSVSFAGVDIPKPKQFAGVNIPRPTVKNLLNYKTETDNPWPKRNVTVAEAAGVNQGGIVSDVMDFFGINSFRRKAQDEAQQRLTERFERQPQQFAGVDVPKPTVQDLLDYEKVSGTPWPKRKVTVAEAAGMNNGGPGGLSSVAFNTPTEVLADWKSPQVMAREKAEEASKLKWDDKDRDYGALKKRIPNGVTIGEVFRHSYGMPAESKPVETWEPPYKDESGALLRRSSTGKVESILGRPPAQKEGDDSGQNTEYQRLRNDVARKWGFSEFARIDEDTARKIEEATVLARQYYESDPSKNMDVAIARANQDVRKKYQSVDAVPPAKQGGWFTPGNKSETESHVRQLIQNGWSGPEIEQILISKGWDTDQARKMIGSAGGSGGGDPLGLR